MNYLIIDENGDVLQANKIDDKVFNMIKGGYWTIVDIQRRKVSAPTSKFDDVIWENIPDYAPL